MALNIGLVKKLNLKKKMIKKVIIILIVINFILGIWFFRDFFKKQFFKNKEVIIEKSEFSKKGEENKENSKQEIKQKDLEDLVIAQGDIKMAELKDKGSIIYYNQNNFLETDLKGSYKKTLSAYPFKNLKTIQCANSMKFCLVWTDKFSIFNLETKENKGFEENVISASLNNQSDGIIFLKKEDQIYQLYSSDLFQEKKIKLKALKGENLKVEINPKNNDFVFYSRNTSKEESGIFLDNLLSEESGKKIVQEDIVDLSWSPDGNKILFSYYDHSVSPKRVQLGYYDLKQEKQFNLGLPGIAQKCAWGEDSLILYCGILATDQPQEFVLDDWYAGKFVSQDVFWKIDLLTSKREKLFGNFGETPLVDSFNTFIKSGELFFVDKISGNLIKRSL
jgi:hypothetical protein